MNPDNTSTPPTLADPDCPAAEFPIPQLVAEVYESAPPALRSRLLEQLMRPLGVLSLAAVANGIFAEIRFHSDWPNKHIPVEVAQNVQASDVMALVERVQQVSVDSVNGLARMLAASPMMTGSAAAALLVTLLMQRACTRREGDGDARTHPRPAGAASVPAPLRSDNNAGFPRHLSTPVA
jgi:hypothetical protein